MEVDAQSGEVPLDSETIKRLHVWIEAERSSPGSGLSMAEDAYALEAIAPATSSVNGEAAALSSSTFDGTQTLRHIRCSSTDCEVVSQVSHRNIFDLGFTTYRSTAKRSNVASGWSRLSSTANCFLLRPSQPRCAGPNSLNVSTTFVSKIFSYVRLPSGGRFEVRFSGSYAGIPGSVTGATPSITCNTANKLCYFR